MDFPFERAPMDIGVDADGKELELSVGAAGARYMMDRHNDLEGFL
jgi:hypothetical protein